MRLPERAEPGTNRPEESARPAAIGTDEIARANPCQTPAPGGLAAIVDALRDELAAQRAENAALRKTIEDLTATIAKLAGGR